MSGHSEEQAGPGQGVSMEPMEAFHHAVCLLLGLYDLQTQGVFIS